MSTFDLENPDPNAGDGFRDEAANLLSARFGRPKREFRASGKKVDIFFTRPDFGKTEKLYVEAKDYDGALTRSQVVSIWTDYSGIVEKNRPASLILVTRNGLTSDAQSFVDDEQSDLRHQTIWELENDTLGLTDYVRSLADLFDKDGLSRYYIDCRATEVSYDFKSKKRTQLSGEIELFGHLRQWLLNDDRKPVAVLGGYGAGKRVWPRELFLTRQRTLLLIP